MSRGTVGTRLGWLAALVVAWGTLPAPARAQTFGPPQGTGPTAAPTARFGTPPGAGTTCGTCSACAAGNCEQSIGTWCGTRCCHFCCPKFHHCAEAPVRICWSYRCAKPVCNPCDVPHFGYWQKCWTPWPYGPDWSHCAAQPPAAQVVLNPATHHLPPPPVPGTSPLRPTSPGDEDGPAPRGNDGRSGF